MRRKTRQTQTQTSRAETGSELRDDAYRSAIACMARTLVADLFDQHDACTRRECRLAGRCQGYKQGGFCPVELDSRQAFLFAAMMAFHDTLRGEIDGVLSPAAAS